MQQKTDQKPISGQRIPQDEALTCQGMRAANTSSLALQHSTPNPANHRSCPSLLWELLPQSVGSLPYPNHLQQAFSWLGSSGTTLRWAGRRWLGGPGGLWAPTPSDQAFCADIWRGSWLFQPTACVQHEEVWHGGKTLKNFQTPLLWPWMVLLIFLTRTSSYYSEG